MAQFQIEGLCKGYALGGRRIEVLRRLELTGDTGEITVILGRSGCGKTTLLRILCGLEQPDSGTISFPKMQRLGMVFQEPRLMPWLTVEQNVTFGLGREQLRSADTGELLRCVGLEGFAQAYPVQLSGGMQQRAALARMLAWGPEVILMDEPFAALDYFTRAAMQRELLRIHRARGMGIVFVTHNIDEAILLGDRICIMAEGRLTRQFCQGACGGERDLLSAPAIRLKRQILASLQEDLEQGPAPLDGAAAEGG